MVSLSFQKIREITIINSLSFFLKLKLPPHENPQNHPSLFHEAGGCFFRVFSLFVVHPWKLTNIPWKLMVGRWNFLLKSSLFSGDVNFQVPRYPQRGKYEETKAREHLQVSSPGILGCLVFFPLPNLPAGLPFRSAKDELARREATLSWVLFWKTGIIKCAGEVLGHHFVWLARFPNHHSFWSKGLSSSKRNHLFLLMVVDYQGMGPKPRWWFQFFWIFTPTWGNDPICLYNIFQMGWNHQLETYFRVSSWKRGYISEVFSFFVGGSKNLNPW